MKSKFGVLLFLKRLSYKSIPLFRNQNWIELNLIWYDYQKKKKSAKK